MAVIGSPPVNTVAPVLSGSTTVGQTLSCDNGMWTGTPTTFGYTWRANNIIIFGAAASTYTLTSAEGGKTVTCTVTASNGLTTSQISNSLGPIGTNSAPANTVLPVISGITTETNTLSVTTGTWTQSPTGYTYQWKRDGANVGTNSNIYLLVLADVGATITCAITASNLAGSATAASAGVGPITAAPTPLSAPVLGYPSPIASNPSTITIDLPADWQKDDILHVKAATNLAFSTGVQNFTHTLTDADAVPGATITLTLPTFSGTNFIEAWGEHASVQSANVSNIVSWGDTTAPVFTNTASQSLTELSPLVIDFTFSVADVASVAVKSGADQLEFETYFSGGAWHARGFGNKMWTFGSPTDQGLNNVYNVDFEATDYGGNKTTQSYALTITQIDQTPTVFAYTDQTNIARSTLTTSAAPSPSTIAGMTAGHDVPCSVSAGEYSLDAGATWIAAGSFTQRNGDPMPLVRITSSAAYETPANVVVTIGTVSDTWTATTLQDPANVSWVPEAPPAGQNIGFGSNSATFANVNFGAGMGIIFTATSDREITGVTVGGASATLVSESNAGATRGVAIWRINIASGGLKSVIISGALALNHVAIATGTMTPSSQTPSSTATPKAYGYTVDPSALASITVPAHGIALCALTSESVTPAQSWDTGTQEVLVTEGADSAGVRLTTAHLRTSGAFSLTGLSSGGTGMVAAAWGP